MDLKELKTKSIAELQKLLSEERARWRDLRFQVAAEQHKQVHELKQSRLTIARILTLLKQLHKDSSQVKTESNKTEK